MRLPAGVIAAIFENHDGVGVQHHGTGLVAPFHHGPLDKDNLGIHASGVYELRGRVSVRFPASRLVPQGLACRCVTVEAVTLAAASFVAVLPSLITLQRQRWSSWLFLRVSSCIHFLR